MTGELDDPLLMSGIGGDSEIGVPSKYIDPDEDFEKPSKMNHDDSELSNGIVGIDTSKKVPKASKQIS